MKTLLLSVVPLFLLSFASAEAPECSGVIRKNLTDNQACGYKNPKAAKVHDNECISLTTGVNVNAAATLAGGPKGRRYTVHCYDWQTYHPEDAGVVRACSFNCGWCPQCGGDPNAALEYPDYFADWGNSTDPGNSTTTGPANSTANGAPAAGNNTAPTVGSTNETEAQYDQSGPGKTGKPPPKKPARFVRRDMFSEAISAE